MTEICPSGRDGLMFLNTLLVCLVAVVGPVKVVGVSDGDTLTVIENNVTTKIRLAGIDAPESGQAFGSRAKSELSRLVFGQHVTYEPESTDQYGRVVAHVSVNGEWVNLWMVNAGMAWHYKRYSSSTELAAAEIMARRNRRGLWVDPNPIPPWDFRKGKL